MKQEKRVIRQGSNREAKGRVKVGQRRKSETNKENNGERKKRRRKTINTIEKKNQ